MLIMFNPARGVIAASRGITPKVLWTRAVEIAKTFDPGRMMDIRAMSPSGLFGLQIPIVMMSGDNKGATGSTGESTVENAFFKRGEDLDSALAKLEENFAGIKTDPPLLNSLLRDLSSDYPLPDEVTAELEKARSAKTIASKIFIRSGFPIDSDDVATYLLREENLSAQEIKALFRCIPKKERKLLFRKLNMINILYGEFSLKYTLNEKEWRGLRLRGEFSAKRTLKEEDFRELRQYVSGFPDGEAIISELMSYELSPSAQVMPLDAAEQIQAVLDFLLPSSRSYLSLQNIIEGSKNLLPLSREQQPVDSAKDVVVSASRTFIEEFRAVCADDAKLIGFMEQILDETVEIPSVEEVREMIPILQDLVDNHQSSRIRGLVLDLAMEIADVLERMEAMEAKSARHNAFMGELAKFSRGYVENGAFINDISLETQKKIIEALESAGIKEIKVKISSPMNMVEIEESVRLLLDFLLGLDDNQRKTILRENANILKFSIENYNGKRLSCVAIYNNEGLAHEDKNDTGSWSAIERIYYGGKVFSNWLEFMRYKFGRK